MKNNIAFIRKGREKSIKNHHPWIFSGAISRIEKNNDTPVVRVVDSGKNFLAWGLLSEKSSLRIRVISFEEKVIPGPDLIKGRIRRSFEWKKRFLQKVTDAFRVINSEGDFLPGLIIDYYNGYVVFQIRSAGMEYFKDEIIQILKDVLNPRGILEKNDVETRKVEGLPLVKEVVYGEVPERVLIKEWEWKFYADLINGQKTGFFLDQRDNRKFLFDIAEREMKILNTFSYTGGFSIPALLRGAKVTNVEISREALKLSMENYKLNGFEPVLDDFIRADVFQFLRDEFSRGKRYDVVVLDPPAFAKTLSSVKNATRGYKDINMNAIKILKSGGLLFTFSCSNHVDATLFQKIVFSALKDTSREGYIIKRLGQPPDHTINLYHPEGEYLKGMVIKVF